MAAVIARSRTPQKCWRLLLVMLPKQEGSADDVAPRAPRKGAGVRLRIWQPRSGAASALSRSASLSRRWRRAAVLRPASARLPGGNPDRDGEARNPAAQ